MARKAGFRASEAGSLTSATGLPVGIYRNVNFFIKKNCPAACCELSRVIPLIKYKDHT